MKIFTTMYEATVKWAEHKYATWFLGGLSFAESSFFPVPVDAMLAPMALGQPKKWWRFALVATVMSVAGGLLGYFFGAVFAEQVQNLMHYLGWEEGYEKARESIDKEGIWVLFMASFTPIPYKLATISAGTLHMSVLPFILVSFVGRGLRFFLVAGLMALFGPVINKKLHNYLEWLGWGFTLLFGAYIVWHVYGDNIKGVLA